MEFHFDLGKPFRPFEQLMGVLPEASKELIPEAYRVQESMIRHCYSSNRLLVLGTHDGCQLANNRLLSTNI